MQFQGKVFLVTGGGRGIGRAVARRLAEEGGRVCIVDRDRHAGLDAARKWRELDVRDACVDVNVGVNVNVNVNVGVNVNVNVGVNVNVNVGA